MIVARLSGDPVAARVVPAKGFTAALTIISAAAMAVLAVFALAIGFGASSLAERWEAELAGTATVRISSPVDQIEAQTDAVLAALAQTPGVAAARRITDEEQTALLAPWFGADLPLEALRLPVLIEVTETGDGPDAVGLRQRLAAEAPGAVYDDHDRWRTPLIEAAGRLRALSLASLVLIAVVVGVTIGLGATGALAANAQIIDVLRLVGARDTWITRAFVHRFTLRAFAGGVAGTVIGVALVILFPDGAETGVLGRLGFEGADWLWPLLVPFAAAALAFVATHAAARRQLREVA